jgi:hypothetical protein
MVNINMVCSFFLVLSACSFTIECFNIFLDTSLAYLCYTRKRKALLWPRTQFGCELAYRETEYVESHHYSHRIEPIHQWMESYPNGYMNQKSKILIIYRSRKTSQPVEKVNWWVFNNAKYHVLQPNYCE